MTFRIDRDGLWQHEGQEVTHPGVLANLWANLRVDGDGHYLQVGPARIPVAVADTPFVVIRVEAGEGRPPEWLRIHLSDGSEERLVVDTTWVDPAGAPYCRVKGSRYTARFAVAAWLQLAEFMDEDSTTGVTILALGGWRLPLSRRP